MLSNWKKEQKHHDCRPDSLYRIFYEASLPKRAKLDNQDKDKTFFLVNFRISLRDMMSFALGRYVNDIALNAFVSTSLDKKFKTSEKITLTCNPAELVVLGT